MYITFGKSPIFGPTGSTTNIYLDQNFYIEKSVKKSSWNTPAHSHNFHEVYYLSQGETDYFIKNTSYTLKPGSIVFIPANTLHKTTSSSNGRERYLIHFYDNIFTHNETLLKNLFKITSLNIPQKKRIIFESILEKISHENSYNDEYSSSLQINLIQEFFLRILRLKDSLNTSEEQKNPSYINEIIRHINENFGEPLSVAQLGEMVFMNKSQLSRNFKRIEGMGINEYINAVRVQNAEKLLSSTNLPITEIAISCGFNSSSYFTAAFKKHKGMTPLKYRQLLQLIN